MVQLLEAHVVTDRRKLKRRLNFWRTFFFVSVLLLLVVGYSAAMNDVSIVSKPYIAKIEIEGTIEHTPKLLEHVDELRLDDDVKGVVVYINSAGGSVVGAESLYEVLCDLSAKKPTIAQMGDLATSAGYYVALGTGYLMAYPSSITGSIGVLLQWPDVSELLKLAKVKLEQIKSSPMKGEPSMAIPITQEGRDMHSLVVQDAHKSFIDVVAKKRNLPVDQVHELANGRILSGRMAKRYKLIDEIGGHGKVLDWLSSKGVDPKLEVVSTFPEKPSLARQLSDILFPEEKLKGSRAIIAEIASLFGLSVSDVEDDPAKGLFSIWHPQK